MFEADLDKALNPPFWDDLETVRKRCKETLLQHGFPDPDWSIFYRGGDEWWRTDAPNLPDPATLKREIKEQGQKYGYALGWSYAFDRSKPFSDPWYAARLAELVFLVTRNREATDPTQLARIMQIGAVLTDWKWRGGFKASILTGQPVRAGASKGGEMRRGNLAPETRERLAAMGKLVNSGQTVKSAAEILTRRGVGSPSSNKKLWERHRDNLK